MRPYQKQDARLSIAKSWRCFCSRSPVGRGTQPLTPHAALGFSALANNLSTASYPPKYLFPPLFNPQCPSSPPRQDLVRSHILPISTSKHPVQPTQAAHQPVRNVPIQSPRRGDRLQRCWYPHLPGPRTNRLELRPRRPRSLLPDQKPIRRTLFTSHPPAAPPRLPQSQPAAGPSPLRHPWRRLLWHCLPRPTGPSGQVSQRREHLPRRGRARTTRVRDPRNASAYSTLSRPAGGDRPLVV